MTWKCGAAVFYDQLFSGGTSMSIDLCTGCILMHNLMHIKSNIFFEREKRLFQKVHRV